MFPIGRSPFFPFQSVPIHYATNAKQEAFSTLFGYFHNSWLILTLARVAQ